MLKYNVNCSETLVPLHIASHCLAKLLPETTSLFIFFISSIMGFVIVAWVKVSWEILNLFRNFATFKRWKYSFHYFLKFHSSASFDHRCGYIFGRAGWGQACSKTSWSPLSDFTHLRSSILADLQLRAVREWAHPPKLKQYEAKPWTENISVSWSICCLMFLLFLLF